MTVAHVREPKESDHVEVMFLESARIFKLPRKNSKFNEILLLLREAATDARAVKVRFASPVSDVIEDVEDPRGR
jgi:hypothetical protein